MLGNGSPSQCHVLMQRKHCVSFHLPLSSPASLKPETVHVPCSENASRHFFINARLYPIAVRARQTVRVDISHPTNTFIPNQALGAGIDRIPAAAADKLFTPQAVNKILTAGWQPVTYRQNTELFVEAWHWNPQGTWSDPAGKGYFTGSAALGELIVRSYGYPLPHRGFTRNDGTGNEGYSRLTDGDPNTYWKSNPYLAKAFTG